MLRIAKDSVQMIIFTSLGIILPRLLFSVRALRLLIGCVILFTGCHSAAQETIFPVKIAASADHTVVLTNDGTVWTWGSNLHGQLGRNTYLATPGRVPGLSNVTAIQATDGYTLALKNDGTLWAWGFGYGATPVQVPGLSDVASVAASNLALKNDGTLWAWNPNDYGQPSQIQVSQVSGLSNIVAVTVGFGRTFVVKSDGAVWAWGRNEYGQLGDGTNIDRSSAVQLPGLSDVVMVAAGYYHTLALKNDGTVWAWGDNYSGALGDGTNTSRWSPIQVTALSGIVEIAANSFHSLALKNDGTLWAWGYNGLGELGDGTQGTSRSIPAPVPGLSGVLTTAAGAYHTIAIKDDERLWGWGQLSDGSGTNRLTPVQISLPELPNPPTGVRADLNGTAFVVSWNAVSNANGYNLYMANSPGVTKSNFLTLPGGHVHPNLTSPIAHVTIPAGTYYLALTAINTAGEGAESAELSVTISATGSALAATVPIEFSAMAVSSSQINLTWHSLPEDVGVAQYKLYRGGVLLDTLSGSPPLTHYEDAGLISSTKYSYTIAACNAVGNCSFQSEPVEATTHSISSGGAVLIQDSPPGWVFVPPTLLEPGFNLLGNVLSTPLYVVPVFGSRDNSVSGITENIVSVWKWNAEDARWVFYSPQLTADENAAYAAERGYDVFATVAPGEGYWINAINAATLPSQYNSAFNYDYSSFSALPAGFNLIATPYPYTPSQFNVRVSQTLPSSGLVPIANFLSLWAWDTSAQNWYFYAPILEALGGLPEVKSTANSRGYRHFQDFGKILGNGVGFWVNRP